MTSVCFMGQHSACGGCACTCHARSLFDAVPPYQRHSQTSRNAAIAIRPKVGSMKAQVLDYLETQEDGATDEEGINALRMNPSTYRPRRIDLVNEGLVVDSGQRRRVQSGEQAVVWKAK